MSTRWWVNQGQTFEYERRAELLWAPTHDRRGRQLSHWESMAAVAPGDEVIHYSAGAVQALSVALGSATELGRPAEFPAAWPGLGRMVPLAIRDLQPPVRLAEIAATQRQTEPSVGPFDRRGAVKQGYLFAVSPSFARYFDDTFGARVQPAKTESVPVSKGPGVYRLNVGQEQLQSCIENKVFAISGSRRDMRTGDILLLQLNKDDATRAGQVDARVQHALVLDKIEPDPTGAVTRAFWPTFAPQPDGHILYCSAVLPVQPFSFTVPPFSKDYRALVNAIPLTQADAQLVLARIEHPRPSPHRQLQTTTQGTSCRPTQRCDEPSSYSPWTRSLPLSRSDSRHPSIGSSRCRATTPGMTSA